MFRLVHEAIPVRCSDQSPKRCYLMLEIPARSVNKRTWTFTVKIHCRLLYSVFEFQLEITQIYVWVNPLQIEIHIHTHSHNFLNKKNLHNNVFQSQRIKWLPFLRQHFFQRKYSHSSLRLCIVLKIKFQEALQLQPLL